MNGHIVYMDRIRDSQSHEPGSIPGVVIVVPAVQHTHAKFFFEKKHNYVLYTRDSKWADGDSGDTSPSHGEDEGSTPSWSTVSHRNLIRRLIGLR